MSLDAFLQQRLHQRMQDNLYRQRKILQTPQTTHVRVNGKPCLSFCSNDYLGLANHPRVIEAFKRGADQYGVGSGASHLVSGHSAAHHYLEDELAVFTGRDRALLFSSGYMANLGVVTALVSKGDHVLEDKLNHASLIDAGLLSGAHFRRYLHNDIESLEKYLRKIEGGNTLIVTDGVFSMDGDIAPLPDLLGIAGKHRAWMMIDDAHGFGVLGTKGGGCAEYFKLTQQQLPILMGTLGKAFGIFGAFVAGSEELIETLIQFSRSYIYTTALPSAVAEAARMSLKLVQEEGWRREKLNSNISYFRAAIQSLNFRLMDSQTPIQPVVVGDNHRVIRIGQYLEEKGLLVGAIRPPTIPEGTARLRITLSADHTRSEIDQLLDALQGAPHD